MSISFIVEKTFVVPVAGLKANGDTNPLSVVMANEPKMIDGDKDAAAAGTTTSWLSGYSYGIDLGTSKTIAGLTAFTIHSGASGAVWYPAPHDFLGMYSSEDNSTWTFLESQHAPTVVFDTAGHFGFTFTLSTNATARYFKIRDDGAAPNPFGHLAILAPGQVLIKIAEIEVVQV